MADVQYEMRVTATLRSEEFPRWLPTRRKDPVVKLEVLATTGEPWGTPTAEVDTGVLSPGRVLLSVSDKPASGGSMTIEVWQRGNQSLVGSGDDGAGSESQTK